jgi:Anti-sigma factor NepR
MNGPTVMMILRNRPAKKPALDEKLRNHLGFQLRQLFAETAEEPIPDRFKSLLDRLQLGEKFPDREGAEAFTSNEAERRLRIVNSRRPCLEKSGNCDSSRCP